MTLHPAILDRSQLNAIRVLGPIACSLGFALGGGTAVALHLGHRRSQDFDWMLDGRLGDPMVLAEKVRRSGLAVEGIQVAEGTLHCTASGVRNSFFEYPYPDLASKVTWPEIRADILSLDDLACMKLAAVAQRGSRKDFVDVFAIASHGRPLVTLLDLYKAKYHTTDVGHVVVGLTYFDDADDEAPLVMLADTSWEEVKRQLKEWVKELAG